MKRRGGAVGDWTDSPPKVFKPMRIPVEDIDPRNYEDDDDRDRVIARRRRAGLPDYPDHPIPRPEPQEA